MPTCCFILHMSCSGILLTIVCLHFIADNLLMSFSEIGKRPPQFCEATFIAQEILDSGFQFDMGEMYYNWFK